MDKEIKHIDPKPGSPLKHENDEETESTQTPAADEADDLTKREG